MLSIDEPGGPLLCVTGRRWPGLETSHRRRRGQRQDRHCPGSFTIDRAGASVTGRLYQRYPYSPAAVQRRTAPRSETTRSQNGIFTEIMKFAIKLGPDTLTPQQRGELERLKKDFALAVQ
jgi:hypothetical protein